MPRLMAAAGNGYITEQSQESLEERSCLRLACDLPDDESTVYTTWFDQETLLPLRSEIAVDGTVAFEVAWNRFEVTGRAAPDEEGATPPETGNQPDASGDQPAEPEQSGGGTQPEPQDLSAQTWSPEEEAAAYASVTD